MKTHWYCEPRETYDIESCPFEGFTPFEFYRGYEYGAVVYHDGCWWYDDGQRFECCRSLSRAIRRWARRCWGRSR